MSSPDPTSPRGVSAALVLLMSAVFVPMAIFRLVDGDEGAYLLAARLVSEGKTLYHDFFYPQMPLIPYLYAGWMKLVGPSWYGARALSALLTVVLGLVLYAHVRRVTEGQRWGVLAALLFTFSSLSFAWLPLVKTFAFGTLMLFAAYAVLSHGPPRWRYFLSGLFLGLAIDARLYLVVAIPAIAIEAVVAERGKAPLLHLARFAIGLVIALLPNEFFMLLDPDVYLFNVLGYQAIRSGEGLIGHLSQKAGVAGLMLGIGEADGITGFQFGLLFFLNLAFVVSSLRTRRRLPLSASIGFLVMFVSFLPSPVYLQYFCMTVPFFAANAVFLLAKIQADLRLATGGAPPPTLRHLFGLLVGAYLLASPLDLYRYTADGRGVAGIYTRANAENWRISTIRRVSRAIDETMPPGSNVAISFWTGYFVEARASILPKMENDFNLWYSPKLSDIQVERYRYLSHEQLGWHVRLHTVPVVVLGNISFQPPKDWRQLWRDILAESGYVMVKKIGIAEVYRWEKAPS